MLIEIDYIKDKLGIEGTKDDHNIAELLLARQKTAEAFCNVESFESIERTKYVDGEGTQELYLYCLPVTAITSIYDDWDRLFGASTLIDSDDYSFDSAKGIVYLDGGVFSKGKQNIKVTYTGGYSAENIPEDLKLAIAQLVMADYIELKGGINAIEGETVIYKPSNLRKQAFLTLDRYKLIR